MLQVLTPRMSQKLWSLINPEESDTPKVANPDSENSVFIFPINCQLKVTKRSLDLSHSTTRQGIAYATDESLLQSCLASSVLVAPC